MKIIPATLTVRPSNARPGFFVICNSATGNAVTYPARQYKATGNHAAHQIRTDASYFRSEDEAQSAIAEWTERAQQLSNLGAVKKPGGSSGWKRSTFMPAMREREQGAEQGDRLPLKCFTHPNARGLVVHRLFHIDSDGFFVEHSGWRVSQGTSGLSASGSTSLTNSKEAKALALKLAEVVDFTKVISASSIPTKKQEQLRAILQDFAA